MLIATHGLVLRVEGLWRNCLAASGLCKKRKKHFHQDMFSSKLQVMSKRLCNKHYIKIPAFCECKLMQPGRNWWPEVSGHPLARSGTAMTAEPLDLTRSRRSDEAFGSGIRVFLFQDRFKQTYKFDEIRISLYEHEHG